MLFHSNDFLYFLTFFLLVYYLVQSSNGARNVLILLASYVFYGWWDYRFVALLLLSSVLDFSFGLALGRCESRSRPQVPGGGKCGREPRSVGLLQVCGFFPRERGVGIGRCWGSMSVGHRSS